VKYYTNKARQAGMTLIELTVVLLVLVGLAGLLIPYVSGFVGKTHDATGSSNIQSLNNAMQRYSIEHYDNFPDKLDSLIEGTDVFPLMMSTIMPGTPGQYLKVLGLDANQAKSFTEVGINTLKQMDSTTNDATFDNTGATDFPMQDAANVLEIDPLVITDLSSVMGKPLNTKRNHYVVFGLGDDSTIAGSTLSDVPVHFSQNGDMGANKAYNHFTVVFEVPKGAYCDGENGTIMGANDGATTVVAADLVTAADAVATPSLANCNAAAMTVASTGANVMVSISFIDPTTAKAKFIGSAMAMGMGHFEGLGGALGRYYENSAQN